jgi:DNA-binding LacI/PurR family transcriptional regulator
MSNAKVLAEQLGISTATVSRALNGKEGMSSALRQRILTAAEELNVVLHSGARALSTTETHQIGFATYHLPEPVVTDPFYAEVMGGAEAELRRQNYAMSLNVLEDEQINDPKRWRTLREHRVDGVILCGPLVPTPFIVKLHVQGVPTVLVDNAIDAAPINATVTDDQGGARSAAEHLLSLGHERVVILSGPQEWYSIRERVQGFQNTYSSRGLPLPLALRGEATTYDTGADLAVRALEHDPTALFCVNDAMAMGAIGTLSARGVRVPEDISVVGFDDVAMSSRWLIPISTVRVERRHLGASAARQLLLRLQQPDAPQQRTLIATTFIQRVSSAPPRSS